MLEVNPHRGITVQDLIHLPIFYRIISFDAFEKSHVLKMTNVILYSEGISGEILSL